MNDKEMLNEIERVLFQFLIATKTHEVAKAIVLEIQGKTGDETFVMNPVTMGSYAPKKQETPVSVTRAINDLKHRGYEDGKNTGVVLEHILKRLDN
jgi:hypothetical protein